MMDMTDTAMLATRLCHDLASPIGAIANTADLMREFGPEVSAEDISMLSRTSEHVSRMLQFYRLVFGRAGPEDPGIDISRLVDLAQCQEVRNRITLTLSGRATGEIPRQTAQIAGMMAMVGRAIVGLRGDIRLMMPVGNTGLPKVAAVGERVDLKPEMYRLLTTPGLKTAEPSLLEFALLRDAVMAVDQTVAVITTDGQVTLGSAFQAEASVEL